MVHTTLNFLLASSVLASLLVLAVLETALLVADVTDFVLDLVSVPVLEQPANIPHTATAKAVSIITLFFISSPFYNFTQRFCNSVAILQRIKYYSLRDLSRDFCKLVAKIYYPISHSAMVSVHTPVAYLS